MTKRAGWVSLILAAAVAAPVASSAQKAEEKKKSITVGKAAGIGALLGFALGGGNVLGDVAGGAALGAAGGMVGGVIEDNKNEKRKQEATAKDAQLGTQQAKIDTLQRELNEAIVARADAETAIIAAIGDDNWQGYKALRGCQHKRAYALAGVGATSDAPDHKLAAVWLEAMTSIDEKNTKRAEGTFASLVENDPEIDTAQQASIATDKAVLDMRSERAELGIGSCS